MTTPLTMAPSAAGARELVSGNRLVALAALDAGCRFFSGYPITPSSEIYQTMMAELPRHGGLGVPAPDEISALAYCVGASLTGAPAMTATSGPGFCLMIETVQYAVMTETPVVIAFVQRLGPSTGGATQGAQGDVMLAEYCTSGGYTIPVFAPGDATQCWRLTREAFAWSAKLRTPVVLLSDKEVGMTLESVALQELVNDGPRGGPRGEPEDGPEGAFSPAVGSAATSVASSGRRLVRTGSAHDRQGRLRKNSPEVIEVLRHLQSKISAHAGEMAMVEEDIRPQARTLVLSWGITSRAAREASRRLNADGRPVSFLQPLTLFPVPEAAIRRAVDRCHTVVIAEENMRGLYADVLMSLLEGKRVVRVNGVGSMITPQAIIQTTLSALGSRLSSGGEW